MLGIVSRFIPNIINVQDGEVKLRILHVVPECLIPPKQVDLLDPAEHLVTVPDEIMIAQAQMNEPNQ